MRLETQDSLKNFFHDCLNKAKENQRLSLQEVTQIYVVHLLEKALDTAKIFASRDTKEMEEPLAFILGRALSTNDTVHKMGLLRQIGDRSLFVSGFFSDSFSAKSIDMDYYISMGEQAYKGVSTIVEEKYNDKLFPEAFSELSTKFRDLVDVMSEISEMAGLTNNQNLLRLYERWMFTKSDRLYGKLKEQGIIALPDMKKDWSN